MRLEEAAAAAAANARGDREAEEEAAAAAAEEAESAAGGRKPKRKGRASAGSHKKSSRVSKKARAAAGAAAAGAGGTSDDESVAMMSMSGVSSSGPWSCGACTFKNGVGTLACAVCGLSRPPPSAGRGAGGAAHESWKCARCTMDNGADQAKCTMCAAPKPEPSADGSGGDIDLTSPPPASSSSAAAAAAASSSSSSTPHRRSEAPKLLQDNLVFLAGLEESVGRIDVSPFLKARLAHSIRSQWTLLESKFRDVDERTFPLVNVQALQKALVHVACQKALRIHRHMQLVLECAQLEIDELAASVCMHCGHSGSELDLLLPTSKCKHPICAKCGHTYIMGKVQLKTCMQMTCPESSCIIESQHKQQTSPARGARACMRGDGCADRCSIIELTDSLPVSFALVCAYAQ